MSCSHKENTRWYDKWVVLVCAFCNYALIDGVRFSFGILYVELLETFKAGKGDTAWIGSVQVGLANLGGVIAGSMVRRFGIVKTILTGSLLSCIGLFSSSFAASIYAMYFTYGVLPGFGLVMMSLSSMVAVGQNFDQQQSLAMGICQAGSSVGGFIFNPLLQMLIVSYGWKGALLIMSGILLHTCAFALLLETFGRRTPSSNAENEDKIDQNNEQDQEKEEEHEISIGEDGLYMDSFGSITLVIKAPQARVVLLEEKYHIKMT